MIVLGLINLLSQVFTVIFSVFPDFNINFDLSALDGFRSALAGVMYMLPGGTVGAIIGLIVTFNVIRILVSFGITLWQQLPLT